LEGISGTYLHAGRLLSFRHSVGAKTALDDLFGNGIILWDMERAYPDTGLAAYAGVNIIEHCSIGGLGQGGDRAVLYALGIETVHTAPMVETLIVDLYEGPEMAAAGAVVILELLNATVCAGIAPCTVRAI
jgi:hypothetical protein